jgi:hypothetical protein
MRENEEAFWTGLVNGFGPPGFSVNYFYDVDQEWEEPWYQDDLSLAGTTVPGKNTDLQVSYNLGYAASTASFGMFMFGVGVYAGATSGFLTTTGVNLVYLIAQIGNSAIPYVRAGVRSIPFLGLLYFALAWGTSVGDSTRRVPLDTRVKG